jgi:hypothetical protein
MAITWSATLVWHSSGCPIDVTLTVMVPGSNSAEIHGVGPGPAGGGTAKAHPAIIKGAAAIGIGVPLSKTRGLGAVDAGHLATHCQ